MKTPRRMLDESWKKDIVLFLSSQTISLFGSSLVQYAIMWYITLTTKSGIMMTIYIVCGFVPTLFLSPLAGVWADRFDRKKLIALSDGMIAIATLLLVVLFFMGYEAIWLLMVISAIRAVGTGIQTPAVGAILPQIVPGEALTKVNGINNTLQAFIMFVSPIVSAAMLTMASMEMIFLVDVVTAAIAIAILMLFVHVRPVRKEAEEEAKTGGYLDDLLQGFRFIKHHAFLKEFFLFFALFYVLMAPAAFLTPLQVTRSFGDEVWRLTAIELAFSIGMMLGGVIIAAWGGFANKIHTMTFASLIMGFFTLCLGVVPFFWIYLCVVAFFGIAMPIFNTPTTVLLQEKIEETYLGRVYGVYGMISTSMMPIGMLIFGPLADVWKIERLLFVTGLLIVVLAFCLGRNKALLESGKPLLKEEKNPSGA